MVVEYGIMSNKWSVEADNKLTAYSCIVIHLHTSANMVALYAPEEVEKDSWLFCDNLEVRLDEIFGGVGAFKKYLEENTDEIRECCKTIKKLV